MTDKNGVVAGELLIGSAFIISMLVLFISYFAYIYPSTQIDMKLQALTDSIAINGKVTETALDNFVSELETQGYTKEDLFPADRSNREGLEIYGYLPRTTGDVVVRNDLIDVPGEIVKPFGRDEGYIRVTLVLPAKGAALNKAAKLYGVATGKEMDHYVYSRSVLSQKYIEATEE